MEEKTQQSFFIEFKVDVRSLRDSFESVRIVLPENTLGACIIRNRGNLKKLTLSIPRMNFETKFNVLGEYDEISKSISFFNFVASLQKSGLCFSLVDDSDSENIKVIRIEVITDDEYAQFLRETQKSLIKLIDD